MQNSFKDPEQSLWIYSQITPYIRGKNKRSGNEHLMQCPFCDEAHTSHKKNAMRGYYYIDTQTYYCFRCEKYASALELYEHLSGMSRKELLPQFMSYVQKNNNGIKGVNFSNFCSITGSHIVNDKENKEIEFNAVPKNLKNKLTKRGLDYLNGRKILESKNLPSYNRFYSAMFKKKYEIVTIPWYMEGEECYYQWRFLDNDVPFPKYGFPKGLSKKVYGIDMIDPSFPFIICTEGVFDSLWIKNGVALGGKVLTDYQKEILEDKFPKHQIVYAFDNDTAGLNAMLKQSSKNVNSLVFYWKDVCNGNKDLNEFAINCDKDYFFNEENVMKCICSPLKLKLKLIRNQH